ncbi:type VI secretion system tube protein Hcp [Terrabacter sp. MAHUQ-38]|uniref:Hcp family type VI secretion system effector n=1 Tax=unclassified Terrabacter TaxID=2630222 RepID=UPI00165E8ACC|nr:type VI secretion system tube protein Hcp [Terrabacter sp. MAHUQ-38]MBC9820547.1 type VI secretion system tube protein Hcp [Terrabacter sp. MAHUQ-38]
MVDGNDAFTTTRRGALKTGALGLGGLTGALALSGSGVAAAAEPPSMATVAALAGVGSGDYFLQLDPILGDSVDDEHRRWIDVMSFSWGASNASSVSGSGWSASKSTISGLSLMAETGSASPQLFLRTMNGKRLATGVLQGVTSGEARTKFLEIELRDVAVTSYQTSASEGGGSPTDSFSLAFAIIKYSIFLQSATGGVGETISATWNVRTSTGG